MNCDEDEDDEDGNDHDAEINKPSYDEMLKSYETIRRGLQFEENTPEGVFGALQTCFFSETLRQPNLKDWVKAYLPQRYFMSVNEKHAYQVSTKSLQQKRVSCQSAYVFAPPYMRGRTWNAGSGGGEDRGFFSALAHFEFEVAGEQFCVPAVVVHAALLGRIHHPCETEKNNMHVRHL
ncbi:hypothetical protein AVEN_184102-1 [Araneus ventricosus]|uniref:Uncharacterized protein n=1 Tax=Araneus ventricosus TaxID=182803 RepID=A0A4Y2CYE4_ARAVE|nr:hypothetical protein AVEN_184102-1 [Araneus ventricosus]